MDRDLEQILNYLEEKRGFDYSAYRNSMIERRVRHRISAAGFTDNKGYLRHLQESPAEPDYLLDTLTINVSRFFRDTLTFEYVSGLIIPEMVAKKKVSPDHSLKIWSAGCATGEEPYSIAILINEFFRKEKTDLDLSIFATDIDRAVLKKAGKGVYDPESIKNIKYHILKRYFLPKGDLYALVPEIKNRVRFSYHDLLDRKHPFPPESIFGHFDMVLCRNVLIYLTLDYQEVVLDNLFRSLAPGGHLVLGRAESPGTGYQRHFRKVTPFCPIYEKI